MPYSKNSVSAQRYNQGQFPNISLRLIRWAFVIEPSQSSRIRRASIRNDLPARVSATPLRSLSNKFIPSSPSRSWICLLKRRLRNVQPVGGVSEVQFLSAATKYSRWRNSMGGSDEYAPSSSECLARRKSISAIDPASVTRVAGDEMAPQKDLLAGSNIYCGSHHFRQLLIGLSFLFKSERLGDSHLLCL